MAINFAGGTDLIDYGNGGSSWVTGCFAFWMKTTQATANALPAALWARATSRHGSGFVLNNTAGKILAQGYDSSTPRMLVSSTTTVNDGNWHHVALNFDTQNGGSNTLFIDGRQEATANSSAAWPINFTGELFLGSAPTFWPSYVGDLAELGLWFNRKLDAAEIAALAKAFSPSKIAPTSLGFHAPLVRSANSRAGGVTPTITGTTELQWSSRRLPSRCRRQGPWRAHETRARLTSLSQTNMKYTRLC
ncbi:LamG domain-containing protein [Mesorhizobium caraganae]|uniref:LamG domain-containing protein n=1 Tax=Mesorhizobium caraganae TaxID=483206 RepID=UPI0033393462